MGHQPRSIVARDHAQVAALEARECEAAFAPRSGAATLALVRRRVQGFLREPEEAWLIGSLAWGGFGSRSDVDLAVRGLTPERACELERCLGAGLGAEVDLLPVENLPVSFRERVLREESRSMAADAGLLARLSRLLTELAIDTAALEATRAQLIGA